MPQTCKIEKKSNSTSRPYNVTVHYQGQIHTQQLILDMEGVSYKIIGNKFWDHWTDKKNPCNICGNYILQLWVRLWKYVGHGFPYRFSAGGRFRGDSQHFKITIILYLLILFLCLPFHENLYTSAFYMPPTLLLYTISIALQM